jgi:hypothetical protein
MGEFYVRVATPADADRLWPLFDEAEKRGPRIVAALLGGATLARAETRRRALVARLLDVEHPIVVAYSGVRAVGYLLMPSGDIFVSAGWRGLGVDEELRHFLQ